MQTMSCQPEEWESDPESWKPSFRGRRIEHGYFPKEASNTEKQVKPAQQAMHCYVADRYKTSDAFFFQETPLFSNLDQDSSKVMFRAITEQWKRETGHLSVFSQKTTHPLYQALIKIGDKVVPYLIEELQKTPKNWFLALRKISHTNPVRVGASVEEAVLDWTAWWNKKASKHAGMD